MNAIEIHDITKTFKGKSKTVVEAVKGLTLAISRGEIFGFLGPNGAGKSTTIKMLMGLIKPAAGSIRIMGNSSSFPISRKHIGYLPENPSFYDYLSAAEYLTFVGKTFDLPERVARDRIESNLKLLDLWDARDRSIRGYSKGMVQRLGLAQALIHDPDVYILDEPMSGLDPIGRALVKEIILDLKARGKSVFFSTHITSDVESICDRVGIIVNGSLQRVDQVDSIMIEGIVGYHLKVRIPGTNENIEFDVSTAELPGTINNMLSSGKEIMLIEPNRKNLEAFFLDIVKGKQC
jgi:ABC-2 type transport system ATP-binding protein